MNAMKNVAREHTIHNHRCLDSSSACFSYTLAAHLANSGESSVALTASVQYTSSKQKRRNYYN